MKEQREGRLTKGEEGKAEDVEARKWKEEKYEQRQERGKGPMRKDNMRGVKGREEETRGR